MDRWKRCPNCAERVEERLATCPFCELPFVETPAPPRAGIPGWILAVVACALIALVLAAIVVPMYSYG